MHDLSKGLANVHLLTRAEILGCGLERKLPAGSMWMMGSQFYMFLGAISTDDWVLAVSSGTTISYVAPTTVEALLVNGRARAITHGDYPALVKRLFENELHD